MNILFVDIQRVIKAPEFGSTIEYVYIYIFVIVCVPVQIFTVKILLRYTKISLAN